MGQHWRGWRVADLVVVMVVGALGGGATVAWSLTPREAYWDSADGSQQVPVSNLSEESSHGEAEGGLEAFA